MTRPGIEPRSPGPLANTLTSRPILPYPRRVEFSGEEVIVLPLASIASLFVDELRSRQPLNGCM